MISVAKIVAVGCCPEAEYRLTAGSESGGPMMTVAELLTSRPDSERLELLNAVSSGVGEANHVSQLVRVALATPDSQTESVDELMGSLTVAIDQLHLARWLLRGWPQHPRPRRSP
jgi:hypothetical protein